MSKPYVYHRAEDLGIPVVDSKSKVFIAVTDHDVINSRKANSKHCALARAALRLPDVVAAYFFRNTAFIEYDNKIVRFMLPPSVQHEIVSFDRAQIFDPGVYQLSPPSPAHDRKAMRDAQKTLRRKRNGSPPPPRTKAEDRSLRDAIAKVAAADPRNETAEQRDFDRNIERTMNNRTSGAVSAKAPAPLLPTGKFVRRTQYVRDLNEPKP